MNEQKNKTVGKGLTFTLVIGIVIFGHLSCAVEKTLKQQINQEVVSHPEHSETEEFYSRLEELKHCIRKDLKYALELEGFATTEAKRENEKLRKENEDLRTMNEELRVLVSKLQDQKNYLLSLVDQLQNQLAIQKNQKENSFPCVSSPYGVYVVSAQACLVPVWIGSQDYKTTYFKITNLETKEIFVYELRAMWQRGRIIELKPGDYQVEVTKIIEEYLNLTRLNKRVVRIGCQRFRVCERPVMELGGRKVHAVLIF